MNRLFESLDLWLLDAGSFDACKEGVICIKSEDIKSEWSMLRSCVGEFTFTDVKISPNHPLINESELSLRVMLAKLAGTHDCWLFHN